MTRLSLDPETARRERDIRGLTNTAMATICHADVKSISAVMNGKPVNLSTAIKVAKLFEAVPPIAGLERLLPEPPTTP